MLTLLMSFSAVICCCCCCFGAGAAAAGGGGGAHHPPCAQSHLLLNDALLAASCHQSIHQPEANHTAGHLCTNLQQRATAKGSRKAVACQHQVKEQTSLKPITWQGTSAATCNSGSNSNKVSRRSS
jgi:hypothetical protein